MTPADLRFESDVKKGPAGMWHKPKRTGVAALEVVFEPFVEVWVGPLALILGV